MSGWSVVQMNESPGWASAAPWGPWTVYWLLLHWISYRNLLNLVYKPKISHDGSREWLQVLIHRDRQCWWAARVLLSVTSVRSSSKLEVSHDLWVACGTECSIAIQCHFSWQECDGEEADMSFRVRKKGSAGLQQLSWCCAAQRAGKSICPFIGGAQIQGQPPKLKTWAVSVHAWKAPTNNVVVLWMMVECWCCFLEHACSLWCS